MSDIEVIEFGDASFKEFEYRDAPYGYDVIQGDLVFGCFANHLVLPTLQCFAVNKEGKGLLTYFLAGAIQDEEEALIFGLPNPTRAFKAKASDFVAVHAIGANFDRDLDLLQEFKSAGLLNDVASFSIEQSWRPWHDKAN